MTFLASNISTESGCAGSFLFSLNDESTLPTTYSTHVWGQIRRVSKTQHHGAVRSHVRKAAQKVAIGGLSESTAPPLR